MDFLELWETAIRTLVDTRCHSAPSERQQQHTRRLTEEDVSLKDVMHLLKKQQERLESLFADGKRLNRRPLHYKAGVLIVACSATREGRKTVKTKTPVNKQEALTYHRPQWRTNCGWARGRLNQQQEHSTGQGCREVSASCCQLCRRECGLIGRFVVGSIDNDRGSSSAATSRKMSADRWIRHHGLR